MSDATAGSGTWSSLFDARSLLSVRVPDGWSLVVLEPAGFRLSSPPDDGAEGFRSTISFRRDGEARLSVASLEDVAEVSGLDLAAGPNDVTFLREERFLLSSMCPVFARWFERTDPDTGRRFLHLQATIADWHFFAVDAVTIGPQAPERLAQFERILASTRILPEPDDLVD